MSTGAWGKATDISSPPGCRNAVDALLNDLKTQRIVWVEGDHLPGEVRSVSEAVETLANSQ